MGDPRSPFPKEPSAKFTVPDTEVNRDGPTVADWNGDGIADLILTEAAETTAERSFSPVRPPTASAPSEWKPSSSTTFPYYDARFGVADFAGNGPRRPRRIRPFTDGSNGCLYLATAYRRPDEITRRLRRLYCNFRCRPLTRGRQLS